MKRMILPLLALTITFSITTPRLCAAQLADEKDYDESVRLPVRRLHPERPTKEQQKQLKAATEKEQKRRAEIDDEMQAGFGNVMKKPKQQSSGKKTAEEKALLDRLLNEDYAITDLRAEMMKPKKGKDEPVRGPKASLMP